MATRGVHFLKDAMEQSQPRLIERLAQKLKRRAAFDGVALVKNPRRGDLSLAPSGSNVKPRPAAVLIPVLLKSQGPMILFTHRRENLKEHAGQISFPGGRQTETDATLKETALREAREEIGLEPSSVAVLGTLCPYRTITHYDVTPHLGVIAEAFTPVLDPREVAAVFEAPVAFFLKKNSLRTRTREEGGLRRTFLAYDFEGRFIWGATAAILANLAEALRAYARAED